MTYSVRLREPAVLRQFCPKSIELSTLARSLQDQLRNLVRMGDEREMTCLHFDGLGAHAPGHEALEIEID